MDTQKFNNTSDFVKEIKNFISSSTGNITIGLSGGSTIPPVLKELMPELHSNPKLQEKVTWTWIDERLVDYNAEGSNWGEVKQFFNESDNTIPLPCEDSQKQAISYQQAINKQALPSLDLLILGFGGDGHIASLFPEKKVENYPCTTDKWLFRSVASYDPKERWTWGMQALTNSKNTFVLFKGDDNSEKKVRVEETQSANCTTPLANYLRETNSRVVFYQIDN